MEGTTLRELAALVQGRLQGDPDLPICGAAPLEHAEPDQIAFLDDLRLKARVERIRGWRRARTARL